MENLRKRIIDCLKKSGKNEDLITKEALKMLFNKIKSIKTGRNYEVSYLLEKFCGFFMACLAVIRAGQSVEKISELEENFKSEGEKIQIGFLEKVLSPMCGRADELAIEIVAYFLYVDNYEVSNFSKKILECAGGLKDAKEIVTKVLKRHIYREVEALKVIATFNAPFAIDQSFKLLSNKNERLRQEALLVFAKAPLDRETAEKVTIFLLSDESEVLWEDTNHRMVCYEFVAHAFKNGLITVARAKDLIKKAFGYESHNRGLSELLPVVELVDSKDEQIVFDGFIAMESTKRDNFSYRDDHVKKFIAGLDKNKRLKYLQETLLASKDTSFVWCMGQHLIAENVVAAMSTFLKIAKLKKTPDKKLGTLAQLAIKLSRKKGRDNWGVDKLNNKSGNRFAGVANALFEYAEGDKCPTNKRFTIAFQSAMYDAEGRFSPRAILLLEKVVLFERDFSDRSKKAIRALLNCQKMNKDLWQQVSDILMNIYNSGHKEDLLDHFLWIMANDIRGDICEPLYYPITKFLKKISAHEAVPILKKALESKQPDGDLGMGARGTYISTLKHFAIEGNWDAVSTIVDYRGGNIMHEDIPRALVEIYRKTSNGAIKSHVARGVSERFILSVRDSSRSNGLFYLCELEAVEKLKDSVVIQEAFLTGIETMGDPKIKISGGMSKILEKVFTIMPAKKQSEVRRALRELIDKLNQTKEDLQSNWAAMRPCSTGRDTIRTIDCLVTEANMLLIG